MPIVQGNTGNWSVMPAALQGLGAPATTVQGVPGQIYIDRSTDPYTIYIFNGAEWDSGVSGTGVFTTLTASGAVDFEDTLNVDGAVTFGDTLDVTGVSTLASLDVTGAATVGTTLDVTGDTTLSTVTTSGDATVGGDLILSAVATQIVMNGGAVTDFIGVATLATGTVTVANTNIAANDRILVVHANPNSSVGIGTLTYTISAGASFTVTALDASGSTEAADESDIVYVIFRQT